MVRFWPRRRYATPGSGRDEFGRLVDGDRVLPLAAPAAPADQHGFTMLLPIITPAARMRGWGRR